MSDVVSDPITLESFCVALSKRDNRVELIGAFHHSESVAGRFMDLPADYQARYRAFAHLPA